MQRGRKLEHRYEISLVFRMPLVILALERLADAFFPLYPQQPDMCSVRLGWHLCEWFQVALLYKAHCLVC